MRVLSGKAGAGGIARGIVVVFEKLQTGDEKLSLEEARQKTLTTVRGIFEKTENQLGEEEAKIFSAYEMLLEDEMLLKSIRDEIDSGLSEEQAVLKVTEQMAGVIEKKGNDYTKQRADDLRYIGKMLSKAIIGEADVWDFPDEGGPFIVAAKELTPVDTMSMDTVKIAGLATEAGGVTSHTVILAKSLGIPAVVGIEGLVDALRNKQDAFIDGDKGKVIVSPDEAVEAEYQRLIEQKLRMAMEVDQINHNAARTKDGKVIRISVNIGKASDMAGLEGVYYDGVGLMRSEFLFLSEKERPSVEKQANAYKEVAAYAGDREMIIRTLDIGGDKQVPYLNLPKEENPFLGNRGIRLCLNNQELFLEHLSSILLVTGKKVKIMLPMVISIQEIKDTKALLEKAKMNLENKGIAYNKNVQIGIMIETPASAIMAEQLSRHCDFFSIGTNDLVQYVTCADRGNTAVQALYDTVNPAVLNLIAHVISIGQKVGIPVSVCGDMASDFRFTELLIGMGLERFSVPVPLVGRLKAVISSVDVAQAKAVSKEALTLESGEDIRAMLEKRERYGV